MSGIYSTQGPGMEPKDTTLRDLLAVVFKRKWLILGIFAVTTCIVGLKTFTAPTTYTADATLLLNRQGARSSVLERNTRQLPWVEVVESEIEVLQSLPVLQMAIAKLSGGASGDTVGITLGQLSKSIRAGVVGESNVLYVSGTSEDRSVAPRITNAVAESYVEYHEQLHELPDPVGLITARSDSVFEEMKALERRRAQLLQEMGTGDIPVQSRSLTNRRGQLQTQLADTQREVARLDAQIAGARAFLENGQGGFPFYEDTGTVQGGSMVNMVRDLSSQRDQLRQLQEKYTDRHPLVVESRLAVESLEESIQNGVGEWIAARQNERAELLSVQRELERQVEEIGLEIRQLLSKTDEVETLESKIGSLRRQYAELSEQSVDSQVIGQSFRDYGVKILSPALGARVNAKADLVRVALGPILALMAGIGLAFYLENLDHSLSNRDDVERHLEIPVLASFPDNGNAHVQSPVAEELVPYRRSGSSRDG